MRLRLKTKFTLTTALLVLGVVALISSLYVATLARQVIRQSDDRARFVAQQVFVQAQRALEDAAEEGTGPASTKPEDLREYVRQVLDANAGLTSLVDSALGYSRDIYEVTVVDHRGVALISSDASLPGRTMPYRPPVGRLVNTDFIGQLVALYGEPRVFEVRLPFNLGPEMFGEIRIGLSTVLLRDQLGPDLRAAAWLALAVVLISTVLAGLVSHMALAPLARISAQLDRIAHGQFDMAPLARADELGQVSSKISQIGRQLARSQEERALERIHAQMQVNARLAALARVTAGAAHEVKNPLNAMRLWLESLKAAASEPAVAQQALKVLDSQIDRLDAVVKRLLEFYRPAELRMEETNLRELIADVLEVMRPQIERARVEAVTDFAENVPAVRVDRSLIKEAMLNLVLNACEAMPAGGRLTLGLASRDGSAVVTVADTGRGIPPEQQSKIFQLFFTTRPDGTGIGLATAFKAVQYHGGSIDFSSEVGRGTTFRIELPLAR